MKSYNKTRTVQALTRDINKIVLDTSIQRKEDQWNKKKKSLLILSGIQGIIIPGVFAKETLNEKNDTIWEVLDGKQRLTTLNSFLNDEFKLDKTLPEEYANKKFSELDEETQNSLINIKQCANITILCCIFVL